MDMRGFLTSSAGVMLLCAGCASMVTIEAKGTQKADATIPSHVTYAVLPTVEVEKDPEFTTYARLIAKKMDERGFKESDAKTAMLGVYLGYGVTESSTSAATSGAPPPIGNPGGMSTGGSGYGGGWVRERCVFIGPDIVQALHQPGGDCRGRLAEVSRGGDVGGVVEK